MAKTSVHSVFDSHAFYALLVDDFLGCGVDEQGLETGHTQS